MHTSLLHAFEHQVRTRADATALIVDDSDRLAKYSWRDLSVLVQSAAVLLDQRFAQSPRLLRHVGYHSRNSLADIVLSLATAAIGAINIPLNELAGIHYNQACWDRVGGLWIDRSEFERSLTNANAKATSDSIRSSAAELEVDSPALLLFTSGTSAAAKGVLLSHKSLLSNAAAKLRAVPQLPSDLRLTCLPLSHAYARTCDFGTWLLSGCTLAITRGFDGWVRIAPKLQPTLANVVPSVADRLRSSDQDAKSLGMARLRLLGCGGAAMSNDAFADWQESGVIVTQGYGCTETGPVVCSATPENALPGLVGTPVQGWETEIRSGRLFVRGVHQMLGYWQDPVATKQRIDDAGWFDTGDIVQIDPPSGQYRILGRADEVIVLPNGHKVHPAAIERRVCDLPGVRYAMLRLHDGKLQLWLDEQTNSPEIQIAATVQSTLENHPRWQQPEQIQRFATPLQFQLGELTTKGTICRSRIEQTRFST